MKDKESGGTGDTNEKQLEIPPETYNQRDMVVVKVE